MYVLMPPTLFPNLLHSLPLQGCTEYLISLPIVLHAAFLPVVVTVGGIGVLRAENRSSYGGKQHFFNSKSLLSKL